MAIKKAVTKPSRREPEPEPPAKKFGKKAAPEPEPEEEPEPEDEPEPEEDEPEPTPKKKLGKESAKKSFADIFDSTKPGRGGMPVGEYKAYLTSLELVGEIADDPDDQGALKVKYTYEGHEDEEEGVAGEEITNQSNLCDENGEAAQGIPFFKSDMDILGYEDVTLGDLEELCQTITDERPLIIIKVVQNGRFKNVYLQGLADGE